jgi:hypothetical protein
LQPCCIGTGGRFCSAAGSHCFLDSTTATYKCQPCGGRGELCCPLTPSEASSSTSGVCTTAGLVCAFGSGGYHCN